MPLKLEKWLQIDSPINANPATPRQEKTSTPQTPTSISLYDGDFFDFNDPESHNYDINTIGHSLSHLCRFTGHTICHYSVAEHSVLVSRMVPYELAFGALMHDAAEAYLGDVSSPLKALLPEYKVLEERVERAIASFFSLDYPLHPLIKAADKALYRAEIVQMTNGHDNIWHVDEGEPDVMITGMQPKDAKNFFLQRFTELTR